MAQQKMKPHMREMTLREIQLAEYALLCKTADVMEAHGLSYFLCGGTLLGAIRHNGFIPWDDDIDILVPRKDYEALKDLIRNGALREGNIQACLPGEEDYPYPFIKVCDTGTYVDDQGLNPRFSACVWIDVFPLDHYPDNGLAYRACFFAQMLRTGALLMETGREGLKKGPLMRAVAGVLCRLLGGYQKITALLDRRGKAMDRRYQKSGHLGNGAWAFPKLGRDYFPETAVSPTVMHLFEDREFPIPENYDENLTHFYGDYMTLPPEEARGTHHIAAYRIEKAVQADVR